MLWLSSFKILTALANKLFECSCDEGSEGLDPAGGHWLESLQELELLDVMVGVEDCESSTNR